jgi:hypothetical protein
LVWSFLGILHFLLFGMEIFILCHCVMEMSKLVYYYCYRHSELSICRVSEETLLGLLSNSRTAQTLGTLRDGQNAFCIVKWEWATGARGRNVIAWIWNVLQRLMCWRLGLQCSNVQRKGSEKVIKS